MLYAEKLMITAKDQVNPLHRHAVKTEDIINRGGGTLVLQMYNSLPDGDVDETTDVVVAADARLRTPEGRLFPAPVARRKRHTLAWKLACLLG